MCGASIWKPLAYMTQKQKNPPAPAEVRTPHLEAGRVDDGEVALLVARPQVHEQLKGGVDDPVGAGSGAVNLVDDHNNLRGAWVEKCGWVGTGKRSCGSRLQPAVKRNRKLKIE